MADSWQLKAKSLYSALIVLFLSASYTFSDTRYVDLSKAANRGFEEPFDNPAGVEDLQKKQGLTSLPAGEQVFRGIPFRILEPAKNNGRSFIALKGRKKQDFPQAVSLPANHLKAAYLYFLHTCRWGGTAANITMAEYDIVYEDGQVIVIPLKVGVELANYFGADDTSASFLAWWYKFKNIDMGLSLFPWKNPHPEKSIQSILFKSMDKAPVPLLFAITASDKELPVSPTSPKPEKTFKTDTKGWLPFEPSSATPVGTAIDMSFLLDAPAGKHGKVKAEGEKLVFEDGTPAKFWGTQLEGNWWNLSDTQMSDLASRLAYSGCNLAAVDLSSQSATDERIQVLAGSLKPKGIYLDLTRRESKPVTDIFESEPAIISQSPWTAGLIYRNDDSRLSAGPLDVLNLPMVTYPETSVPFHLSHRRSLGTPYRAEWRNGWPNEYLSETPLLVGAYGSFGDWGACLGMGLSGEGISTEMKVDTDLSNKPVLSIQWPVAALAFLRGDLKAGKLFVLEPRAEMPDIATALKTLAHRSGLGIDGKLKSDPSGELKAKVNAKTKSFVSDTDQISWQGNVGVVKVSSPRFQALIGFLGHRKLNSPVWEVETPNFFASLSCISLNKNAITASDHLLLTGVTRMENTGMVYNGDKTKLISAGTAPILVEPLSAKITVYRFKKDPALKVRALDANGQPLTVKVPAKWAKNNLVLSWVPSAFYLEVYK